MIAAVNTEIWGEQKKFLVLSRPGIREFTHARPYLVLSVHSPGDPPAQLAEDPNRLAVVDLDFDDTVHYSTALQRMAGWHVKKILDALDAYAEQAELIVCQCEAGVSRSAGLCAALMAFYGEDDSELYRTRHPNVHVKSELLRALERRAEKRSRDHEATD